MSDPWVTNTQQWLNETYSDVPGWDPVEVNGRTGWSTMYALTKALQHELGITALSNNFGPATMAAVQALGPVGPSTSHPNIENINNIIVGALYCKGYNGGQGLLNGTYSIYTVNAVQLMATNIGLVDAEGVVFPKLFKALLTMDAYVRLLGGSDELRNAQQWLNRQYHHRASFDIIPTDGLGSRSVLRALVYGIQYEVGMTDSQANGNFGPGTQEGLRTQGRVSLGSSDTTKHFVKLFTAAMLVNREDVTFSGTFTSDLEAKVQAFQAFAQLALTGEGDFRTWSSLLSSRGDTSRPATASDTATPLTADSAAALYAAGYRLVGRYLSTAGSDPTWKVIQPGELQTIISAGLRVFPIFQLTGDTVGYFTEAQGFSDGKAAVTAADGFGFPSHTTIYFAVDVDAQDGHITSNVLPYFRGVLRGVRDDPARPYTVGVYGTRNVCTRVSETYGLQHSFVSDMSSGYSGNMGFPLPRNWSIDQIATVTVPYPGGSIEIDRNVWMQTPSARNRGGVDMGVDSLVQVLDPNIEFFHWVDFLESLAATYRSENPNAASVRDLTLQYLRGAGGNYRAPHWDVVGGGDDDSWFNRVQQTLSETGREPVLQVVDPWTGQTITVDHMAFTTQSVILHGNATSDIPNLADIGGWGGDMIQTLADYVGGDHSYSSPRAFAAATIGTTMHVSRFSLDDLLADIDATNIGQAMLDDPSLTVSLAMLQAYASAGSTGAFRTRNRWQEFVQRRFGNDIPGRAFEFVTYEDDLVLASMRAAVMLPYSLGVVPEATIQGIAEGFGDVLNRFA